MQLKQGTLLKEGIYRIEKVLGQGSFGITYLATIVKGKRNGQKVAIKEFFMRGINSRTENGEVTSCSDNSLSGHYREKFICEAEKLTSMNHPNIVNAFDVIEELNTSYYVMDYVQGEDLNSYLKKYKISINEAIDIATKVAYGLNYMHESQHMLHLDLKPGNIMRRSSDGEIILIDFGLSKYYNSQGTPDTSTDIGLGTNGYAPIEQISYDGTSKDFKTTIDVYALGATFYKLLTGKTPLNAYEYLSKSDDIECELSLVGVPVNIIEIVKKAMSPSPKLRYQTVRDLIYALNAKEKKRDRKGVLNSFVGFICLVLAIFLSVTIFRYLSRMKKESYNSKRPYAFMIKQNNMGANHYGEMNEYKFFSDGTGFHKLDAWHDKMDCVGDCDLTAHIDTATFKCIIGPDFIVYPSDDWGTTVKDTVWFDFYNQRIELDRGREYDSRFLDEDIINWDDIRKIFNK